MTNKTILHVNLKNLIQTEQPCHKRKQCKSFLQALQVLREPANLTTYIINVLHFVMHILAF